MSLLCGKPHYLINTYVIMSKSLNALNMYFLLCKLGRRKRKRKRRRKAGKEGLSREKTRKIM